MCLICLSQPRKPEICRVETEALSALRALAEDQGDAPDSFGPTPYSMALGDTFAGNLATAGDEDLVEITLDPGETVEISMTGGSLSDPLLVLYDASGTQLAENDDFQGLDSQITYTSDTGGSYFVLASSFAQSGTGSYTLEASLGRPFDDPLRALDGGVQVFGTSPSGGVIEVYLATRGETFDGVTSEGFNAYERGQIAEVFAVYESYLNVTFAFTNDAASADWQLVLDTNELGAGFFGYFYLPDRSDAPQVGAFNGAEWDRSPGGDLEPGGYGFVTFLHEFGHGLGLEHPFDGVVLPGATAAFGPRAVGLFELNQGLYTTLTYADGYQAGPVGTAASGDDFGYQAGPMALDIAVLQDDYGANPTTGTGDTRYALPDQNAPGTLWQAIWDVSGVDTLTYDGARDAVIDLRAATLAHDFGGGGFVSAADGIQGGFTIAHGVEIENAEGGAGADLLQGNAGANLLRGQAGADTLRGAAGQDTLEGGAGRDKLFGGENADLIHGQGGRDRIAAGAGADEVQGGSGRDVIGGGGGQDTLLGGNGVDILRGGNGDDRLSGGRDNDTLDGGKGNDRLSGEAGGDVFVFAGPFGRDVIVDFDAAEGDVIDLSAVAAIADFADLGANHMAQRGDHVVIDDLAGNLIIVRNTALTELTGDQILF